MTEFKRQKRLEDAYCDAMNNKSWTLAAEISNEMNRNIIESQEYKTWSKTTREHEEAQQKLAQKYDKW